MCMHQGTHLEAASALMWVSTAFRSASGTCAVHQAGSAPYSSAVSSAAAAAGCSAAADALLPRLRLLPRKLQGVVAAGAGGTVSGVPAALARARVTRRLGVVWLSSSCGGCMDARAGRLRRPLTGVTAGAPSGPAVVTGVAAGAANGTAAATSCSP